MLCLHACFRFCPSEAPPPVSAHSPPTSPSPRATPILLPLWVKSHFNVKRESMQSVLSDVAECCSNPLPASSSPAPPLMPPPPFTIYLQAYISAFALSPLSGLCTSVNMQLLVTGAHSAAH